jgi:hypothetical protein
MRVGDAAVASSPLAFAPAPGPTLGSAIDPPVDPAVTGGVGCRRPARV